MASPSSVCPFCGQPLVNRAAIEHLHREQPAFERRLREQTEKKLAARIRAEVTAEIRRDVEREYRKKQKAYAGEKMEQSQAIIKGLREELKRGDRIHVRENEMMKEQLDRWRRRAERVEAAERGELSEEDLLQSLGQAFEPKGDQVKPVGRGKAGSDIIHTVRDRVDGQLADAGTIIYESKDTLDWSEGFVAQAMEAKKTYGTPHVVLVSRAFPKKERDLCWRDGVPVVSPSRAVALAHVIRRFIIQAHRAGLSGRDAGRKTEELYAYIRGEAFKRRLEDIVEISRKLGEGLKAERRQHTRHWTRREKAYADLSYLATEIEETIRSIIERRADESRRKVATHKPRADPRRVRR